MSERVEAADTSPRREQWRLLPWSAGSAAHELAGGAALLAGVAHAGAAGQVPRPSVRWYSVAAPALVIGAGQPLAQVESTACAAAGITVHRRSSGGTAVLLEPTMLMQDVALPRAHLLHRSDVTDSYRWLGAVWVAALQRLGLDAALIAVADARADTKALDTLTRLACYGGRSPYEVSIGGRKVVGFAQVRRRDGVLLQVGIYTDWAPQRLAAVLALTPAERAVLVQRLGERVAGIAPATGGAWHLSGGTAAPAPPADVYQQRFLPLMQAFAAALQALQHTALVADAWSGAENTARVERRAQYEPLQ
jgi:lipoate-protein ligase A